MLIKIKKFFLNEYKFDYGHKSFLIGVFFLPSALPISAFFLLISLIFSYKNQNPFSITDKWNYPLYISIGLILFSTLNITLINTPLILSDYDIKIIWINLFNWLPTFIFYFGFQNYLKTENQRFVFIKFLLSGSFPVIVSLISQKFFSFYGPYKTLFGLIIWFQKPLYAENDPIAGLFSNPNYAGIWLALILPFAISLLKFSKSNIYKKIILLIFSTLILYMILLTGSRNGLLAIIVTTICLYSFKKILIIIGPIVTFIITYNLLGEKLKNADNFLNDLIPSHLFSRLNELSFYNIPRIDIWKSALLRIKERPFWGWGPSTFSFLNIENNPTFKVPKQIIDAQHSHNIALEIAHNFGIPLSIILTSTIFLLLLKGGYLITKKFDFKDNFHLRKAWFASSTIIFISHLSDITYYDGKINILIGILFAGLKCIIDE